MSRGSGNEWSRLDQGNSLPAHFSLPSSLRSSAYSNLMPRPGSGPTGWQQHNHVPVSSFRQTSDTRFGATTGMRQFEESDIVRRDTRSNTGFPVEPYPPVQAVPSNSMAQETGPRMAPFPREPPPRFPWLHNKVHNEHEKALKMLKKEIYSSQPKNLARKVSLFYTDMSGNGDSTIWGNNRETNEDSKRCAICLDDFEPGNEVMVTPCNHMFHEECILPWMKSHGQCPVCRYVISQQITANATAMSSRNAPPPTLLVEDDPFIGEDVLLLIRAMDEAFSWERLR